MEIGIYTLADIGPNPLTKQTISAKERLDEIIQAARLADEAGLDLFGVGEHHRLDYASSSPAVILAAIAQVTNRIRLLSTTSVLSTLDPVRLFEDLQQSTYYPMVEQKLWLVEEHLLNRFLSLVTVQTIMMNYLKNICSY